MVPPHYMPGTINVSLLLGVTFSNDFFKKNKIMSLFYVFLLKTQDKTVFFNINL